MLSARIDVTTGALLIDGFPIAIDRRLTEQQFRHFSEGVFERSQGVLPPSSIFMSVPLSLAGRELQALVCFRSGRLERIALSLVGLEWWTREGHRQNTALCRELFGRRRRFEGGKILLRFEAPAGPLYDGGAVFSLQFDPPDSKAE